MNSEAHDESDNFANIDDTGVDIYFSHHLFWDWIVALDVWLLSISQKGGCYQYHKRVCGDKVDNVEVDAEQAKCNVPEPGAVGQTSLNSDRQPATKWAYLFQIIFQMNAGAVMLTDCVFWFILVPFLAIKDYHLNACCLFGNGGMSKLMLLQLRG